MATEGELTKRAKFFSDTLWHKKCNLPIKINGRYRSTMGAYHEGQKIELARFVLSDEYILSDTLLHELCHWYCDEIGVNSDDGACDFERELERIGASSTEIYGMGDNIVYDIKILTLNKLYKEFISNGLTTN